MTNTIVQQPVSFEELKQVVIALIKENNAEFKQLLAVPVPKRVPSRKKIKEKQVPLNGTPVKKERIPYNEMPFWKANPHLKPLEPIPSTTKKEFLDAIMAFATNPETQLTDEMIEGIDDDI